MDYNPPGSSAHEISQARILEWVAIPFSRRSSPPRDWTHVSCLAGRCFFVVLSLSFFFFLLYNIVLVLLYINMHPPQVYMCSPPWISLPPPSPYHASGSSQCTSPRLPVSCIKPGLETHFLYDIIHVLMPFSQIIAPPTPTESKRLFYTSVSLLLSCIQGCHYLWPTWGSSTEETVYDLFSGKKGIKRNSSSTVGPRTIKTSFYPLYF